MAQREAYVRTSVTWQGVEYIVGLALWPKERIGELVVRLRNLMDQVHLSRSYADWYERAKTLEERLRREWPDRPFFIEVGNEADHWIQLFQPWDVPMSDYFGNWPGLGHAPGCESKPRTARGCYCGGDHQ